MHAMFVFFALGLHKCFTHWLMLNNQVCYVKPKLHLMAELFQYQAFELGNPIEYTEYIDGYVMGKVAPLATRKVWNNSHQAMKWDCTQRYRALLSMWQV